MTVPKVLGIETEYGISERDRPGDGQNPINSSSLLINAYVSTISRPVGWDFEDEHPDIDARAEASLASQPPEVEKHLVNAVLTNGARLYVDHAHPEYSSPECRDPLEAVRWDRAGEQIVTQAIEFAQQQFGRELVVHKNNSDGKGNSYGCHENYLCDRTVPFSRFVHQLTPHFVSRQIYTGSGKLGSEFAARHEWPTAIPYQLSQRADFFEEEVGLETTLKRPIINTRDEPHSDAAKYRRLHVIVGDANMSETATFLKLGTTAIILTLIELDLIKPKELELRNPVRLMTKVSYDLSLGTTLERKAGSALSALDIQIEYLDAAKKLFVSDGIPSVGSTQVVEQILNEWELVLDALAVERKNGGVANGLSYNGTQTLAKKVDWAAKYGLLWDYKDKHAMQWNESKLSAIALQYHDMRRGKNLSERLNLDRIVAQPLVDAAMTEPPETTRAWFRGACLSRYAANVSAANWDSIVFDLGTDPLRRVPMMEPLRGTKELASQLLDSSATAADLVANLGA